MIRILILLLLPVVAQAETIRIATYNTELSRDGPGLLLRDIDRGDEQVMAVVGVLAETRPDIIALQGLDWDFEGQILAAMANRLRDAGMDYPFTFAARPNSGLETDLDLDGDGRTNGPGDAQGWGRFTGQGGLAVMSRFPIALDEVQDLSDILWQDLPGAELPRRDAAPYPSQQAQNVQRLSSVAHWIVPIETPAGRMDLMTFHASPPVFDGPEDRNGLRNRDEIRLWSAVLDGQIGHNSHGPFVIAGDANLDPSRGEGRKEAIRDLLNDPRVQDPAPTDPSGDLTTVVWKTVGPMRVDYVLPSTDWQVAGSGVHWPAPGTRERNTAEAASRHRLIWVDLTLPR
ncbi:endonuclease/exonuclease/phosphatase family protein [Ruegeria atlantica]|uniref:endonuclease/exonuclease/phosphatase family protein n=1 Tax=Ruegeria atlantica TaxID=81569 RepID=UPI00147E6E0D|nr:endonuclease/exonuclease/phosphatase family protein [Ruegeria atlantica]